MDATEAWERLFRKFTSLNSCDADRVVITREEWNAIKTFALWPERYTRLRESAIKAIVREAWTEKLQ